MRLALTLVSCAGITLTACAGDRPLASADPVDRDPPGDVGSAAGLFRVVDLGTLGGADSVAAALNDRGQIVGVSEDATGTLRAFIWTEADGMRPIPELDADIDILPGILVAAQLDINNRGWVVSDTRLWVGDGYVDLVAREDFPGSGEAINDRGDILVRGSVEGIATARWHLWSLCGGATTILETPDDPRIELSVCV